MRLISALKSKNSGFYFVRARKITENNQFAATALKILMLIPKNSPNLFLCPQKFGMIHLKERFNVRILGQRYARGVRIKH